MKELIVKVDDAGVYHIEGELIRCKDCEFFHPRSVYGHGLCDVHCNGVGESEVVSETYYCSWAERKEE